MSHRPRIAHKHPLTTWLTAAQADGVAQAATAEGLSLSAFVRLVLLREAKRRARRRDGEPDGRPKA
jgi:hypothetical protein